MAVKPLQPMNIIGPVARSSAPVAKAVKDESSAQTGDWSSSRSTGKKRRVPRRSITARVGVLYKGQYSVCHAVEIGEGGMLFSSFDDIQKDDRVVVTLRIPDVLQGVAIGTVMYTVEGKRIGEPHRYGIQFDKIEFDLKRKIRNFVASSSTSLKVEPE